MREREKKGPIQKSEVVGNSPVYYCASIQGRQTVLKREEEKERRGKRTTIDFSLTLKESGGEIKERVIATVFGSIYFCCFRLASFIIS